MNERISSRNSPDFPITTLGGQISLAILRSPIALAFILPALYMAWNFPVASTQLSLGLVVYFAVLLVWPATWLIIVPAAIPILELGIWSGRIYFSEFDMLLLVTFGGVFWRRGISLAGGGWALGILATVLFVYNVFVTWNGLIPYQEGALGQWNDELSSLNSIREAKGFFAAFLFLPLILIERRAGTNLSRWFSLGMVLGLVTVSATILWERLLFTGLTNFSHPYRVSGHFFGIVTGGAAIDAFLMMVTPFIGALILFRPRFWTIVPTLLFTGLAGYCLYVTYSRTNYPAVLAAFMVFAIGAWMVLPWRTLLKPRHIVAALVIGVLGAATSYHMYYGTNIEKRFAQTTEDLKTRFDHWSSVLKVMNTKPHATWIGMGKGVFPLEYYVDSIYSGKPLTAPALTHNETESFISFTPGADSGGVYLRQRLNLSAGDKYQLKLKLRVASGKGDRVLIEFCERHILKFKTECLWKGVNVPKGNKDWVELTKNVNLRYLGKDGFGSFGRPVDISIMNRGIDEQVDIGLVEIHHSSGLQILRNGDFSQGLDYWFFSHENHLRWHIKNVFVQMFFEGGMIGLFILFLTLIIVGYRLLIRIIRKDPMAVLLASAITGTLFIGLFDSLFDEPRITFLFTLMIWLSVLVEPRTKRRRNHYRSKDNPRDLPPDYPSPPTLSNS